MYSGDKNIMKYLDNNSATNEETILKAINIIEEKNTMNKWEIKLYLWWKAKYS